jgi:plasmid stabilization system protein ParE
MRFTVVWNPSAESQLSEIWLEAKDRAGVTSAANEIDKKLRHSPETVGESRSGGRRIAIVPPLAIFFRVDEEDQLVRVLFVRKVE